MWDTFDDIAQSQGWNTESQFRVLFDFVSSRELDKELALFAQGVADTENGLD